MRLGFNCVGGEAGALEGKGTPTKWLESLWMMKGLCLLNPGDYWTWKSTRIRRERSSPMAETSFLVQPSKTGSGGPDVPLLTWRRRALPEGSSGQSFH